MSNVRSLVTVNVRVVAPSVTVTVLAAEVTVTVGLAVLPVTVRLPPRVEKLSDGVSRSSRVSKRGAQDFAFIGAISLSKRNSESPTGLPQKGYRGRPKRRGVFARRSDGVPSSWGEALRAIKHRRP